MIKDQNRSKKLFEIPKYYQKHAYIDLKQYKALYKESIERPEAFWANQAERLHWFKKWTKVKEADFNSGEIAWYIGGKINVSYNCLDRHILAGKQNQAALIWEGDDPSETITFTYLQLQQKVCRFANVMKKHGVKKGDIVVLYMPMIPELSIAVLACARIGVVHSVVFGGFSAEALHNRLLDCTPKMVITADGGFRGGSTIPLKHACDEAMKNTDIQTCIVVKRTKNPIQILTPRDYWWHTEMQSSDITNNCPAEEMDAQDPLFILYTSGSTGKPKGILHTTAGYLVYVSLTHHYIFNYEQGDTYWCTADIGWITGHSYILYGPLSNGATTLMYEGTPNYPNWDRFWDIIDRHQVNIFYTAPTAIRALAKAGDKFIKNHSLSSLKLLGTVGEPINPETWLWYHEKVGQSRCPIVDTWWQTETGGIMISSLPGAIKTKPGSASLPFFGIKPLLFDDKENIIKGVGSGNLCIKSSWPGQMCSIYGDKDRFYDTYFSLYKGYYFTGDGCMRDKDGYYWITGRVDDVINVSGHRLGTAEIESALVNHNCVAEAAVVGVYHEIKGQAIYAFITLNNGIQGNQSLRNELILEVRTKIGAIVTIDFIQWVPDLPKTRSGKIMRRILRKIAENKPENIGDISTLANPDIVKILLQGNKGV